MKAVENRWKIGAVIALAVMWAFPVSLMLPTVVGAQPGAGLAGDAYAHEAITVSTTAIGPTAATVSPTTAAGARQMLCTAEAASATSMRYRFDGTAPTTSTGHYVMAGVVGTSAPALISVEGRNNVIRFKAIRQAAVDVTLRCTYLR